MTVTGWILAVIAAWLGKRAIAAMDWMFHFLLGWYRASSQLRCYAFTRAHTQWMQKTLKQIESGQLRDPQQIEWMKRFHLWCDARLDKWQERVRDRKAVGEG